MPYSILRWIESLCTNDDTEVDDYLQSEAGIKAWKAFQQYHKKTHGVTVNYIQFIDLVMSVKSD